MNAPSTPDDPSTASPPRLGATLALYAGVAAATLAIEHGGRWLGLSGYTHATLAVLFLIVAVQGAQRGPGGLAAHGLWLGGLLEPPQEPTPGFWGGMIDLWRSLRDAAPSALRETAVALLVAAVTFPPFIVGFYLYNSPIHPFAFRLPDRPLDYMASQLLVVALPEEALFRGLFQTRLSLVFNRPLRIFGLHLSVRSILLQAALFGILHFAVDLNPERLAVFFPALLFGLMRDIRHGIGAAIVYHALCNLLSDVLARGWL